MADEDELNDLEINKTEKRIKDLSEKVKTTSQERDDLAKAKDEAENAKVEALKEVEFFKGFAGQTSKYSAASEFQDKIREKVMAGYDIEDATVSVLAKEGKLDNLVKPPKPQSPVGGSATNNIQQGADKSIDEMTRDEKRAKLMERERAGDISLQ